MGGLGGVEMMDHLYGHRGCVWKVPPGDSDELFVGEAVDIDDARGLHPRGAC